MTRRFSYTFAGIWTCLLLINLLARCSRSFSDWYVRTIFPHFSAFWSRITGCVPFSVGEWLIVLGIVLAVLGVLSFPVCLFVWRKRAAKVYAIGYGSILTWLFAVLTFHFFILYQCTPLAERYFSETSYTETEVLDVLECLIEEANAASLEITRDADGRFCLTDDLQAEAKAAMQKLGEWDSQFDGWYPDAKPIAHSYFFSQQYLLGIYFPFSMEANYNPDTYPVNLPNTVCHELVHLKGNIFEDEAGFLSFLACRGSDSADFRYSGYILALEYMLDVEIQSETERYAALQERISSAIWTDLYGFVPDDYWKEHAEQAILPETILSSDTIQEAARQIIDTNLKANGVAEGRKSYSGIVNLLLHLYIS